MKLEYSAKAQEHLANLPKDIAERIVQKMDWFCAQENPLTFAIQLSATREKLYRFRIGEFRAVCVIKSGVINILFVLAIKNRREAYR